MQNLNQPRKPTLALAMSFVLPGFGQLYNGEPNKATWLFLCFVLLSGPAVAVIALYLPEFWVVPILFFSLLLTISIWLYGVVDAWRTARRTQNTSHFGWHLSSVYVLLFFLGILAELSVINYIRDHQVQSFRIPSGSMKPGVLPGDLLFSDMRYNCPGCKSSIQRGDVAIFVYPNNRTRYYIKRIIALPGDVIRIKGHEVWVNNKSLTVEGVQNSFGRLVTEEIDARQWKVQWANFDKQGANVDMIVPPGRAFVLGDNRSTSKDTRDFGTVPLQDIVGRAHQIWFSVTSKDGVRWERPGKLIK
jgi:signal peptidase I